MIEFDDKWITHEQIAKVIGELYPEGYWTISFTWKEPNAD